MSAPTTADPEPRHASSPTDPGAAEASRGVDHSAKIRLLEIVAEQPAESTYDDVLRELAFYRLVRRGLRSLEGHRYSTEQIRQRVKTWRS